MTTINFLSMTLTRTRPLCGAGASGNETDGTTADMDLVIEPVIELIVEELIVDLTVELIVEWVSLGTSGSISLGDWLWASTGETTRSVRMSKCAASK